MFVGGGVLETFSISQLATKTGTNIETYPGFCLSRKKMHFRQAEHHKFFEYWIFSKKMFSQMESFTENWWISRDARLLKNIFPFFVQFLNFLLEISNGLHSFRIPETFRNTKNYGGHHNFLNIVEKIVTPGPKDVDNYYPRKIEISSIL